MSRSWNAGFTSWGGLRRALRAYRAFNSSGSTSPPQPSATASVSSAKYAARLRAVRSVPQAAEQLDGVCRVQHGPLAPFIQGHLGIRQQLAGCGHAAALAPGAPGDDRQLPPVRGQHGENLVRVPGIGLPQHQAAGHKSFRLHPAASLYSKYASGAPVAQNRSHRPSIRLTSTYSVPLFRRRHEWKLLEGGLVSGRA